MKKYFIFGITGGLLTLALTAGSVFAQGFGERGDNMPQGGGRPEGRPWGMMQGQGGTAMRPFVVGKVTAVSGNTITLQANATSTNTFFTVDATNAKIFKGSATTTVSVSSVSVGDNIAVSGTVSGTNIVATMIRDGKIREEMMGGRSGEDRGQGEGDRNGKASSTNKFPENGMGSGRNKGMPPAIVEGNGQPVIGGQISAISGNTLTVTTRTNLSYTVDATNAKIVKQGATSTLSGLVVGDSVMVQGGVNGTNITASTVIDQGVRSTNAPASTTPGNMPGPRSGFGGFMNSIGGFFGRIFRF